MMGIAPGDHQTDLKKKVAGVFASRTRAEWEAFAKDHDCCLEPVLEPSELRADPQHVARGVFALGSGQLKLPTCDATMRLPPPKQGEHTDVILREAGLDEATIAKLRSSGTPR
jgi:alpha-methylacyl-CoA racemase